MAEEKMKATKSKTETKKCKFCRSDMPYDAKVCPTCRKKQGGGCLKWGVIAFIVLFVLGALGSSLDDKPKQVNTKGNEGQAENKQGQAEGRQEQTENEQGQTESQQNPVEEPQAKDTFSIGETAELNDVQVTLTNYQENAGSEWIAPAEGNVFVLVEFEIANNSDSEIRVSSLVSFEAYVDDYAASLSLEALMQNEQNQLDGSVAVGKKMRGWIGYEVPAGWKNLEIHFTDNVWSNNKFKFKIEK